jgi:hypothetical protein
MAVFEPAFTATLVNEGFPGFNRDNNGADVCAGINRASWPGWAGWLKIDFLRSNGLDRSEINAELKKDPDLIGKVQDFYRRNFWAPWMGQLSAQPVANWAFDKGVNMGLHEMVVLLQRAAGVVDDGKFGPKSLAAVNGADPAQLVKAAHDQAVKFYQALHVKDPAKYPADMVNRA